MTTAAELFQQQAVPFFTEDEWPAGVLENMNATVILALSKARQAVPASHRMDPSPVPGSHVRKSGTSRHSTFGGRLSDATDFFTDWAHAWDVHAALQRIPEIGGIGFYTDMMYRGTEGDRAMFHIDTRPERLNWVGWRTDRHSPTVYVYQHRDPLRYHHILATRGKYG